METKTITLLNDGKSIKNSDVGYDGDFYWLSQAADGTETTLLPMDRPAPESEQVIFVFKTKDFEEVITMANQFLGFV